MTLYLGSKRLFQEFICNISICSSVIINRGPVPYLVVVAIGDGIGVNSSLLHLKQDPHCQHRLAVLSTQLHENPVTHLRR